MADHIGGREPADGDAFDPFQHLGRFAEAAHHPWGQVHLGGIASHHHAGVFAQPGEQHAHLAGGCVLGLIEDHKGIGQGATAHVGQGRHFDNPLLEQGSGAFGPQQGVEGVVEGAQVGIHLLLEVSREEPQPFAGLHRWSGEHQALHLALGQHAHGQHRGQKGFACAGRAQGQGEVVAFHGLDVGLLLQGARPQRFAVLAFGQHLAPHLLVFLPPAGI